MKLRGNEDLRERLAAEYVLGTLRGRARRRFEGLMHDDAALRRTTREWSERLGAMAEFVPAVVPGRRVWRAIEGRLNARVAAPRWQFWRHGSLAVWRGFGLASSALAALLLVAVLLDRPDTARMSDIASLLDAQNRPALVVTADRERGLMTVKVVTNVPLTAQQALQLWAVPRAGKPRSLGVLGVVGTSRELTLPLPAGAIGADVAVLAVSLEPKGGSTNPNGPSGPILYKGGWVRLI